MVQATRSEILSRKLGKIYEQYDENESIATTSSFVTLLDIDARAVKESVIVIHNEAGGDLDYQILGNAKDIRSVVAPTGTNDDDKGWVVLATGAIATTEVPEIQTFSNPYSKVILQVKHTTATTDVSAWHRGEN